MSFERKIKESDKESVVSLDVSIIKFFYQINPFFNSGHKTESGFLRRLKIFDSFTDMELWNFTKYLHKRTFEKGEIIFNEGDTGVGFYFIQHGSVDIVIEKNHADPSDERKGARVVVQLAKNDYFGELALLQKKHNRTATARAASNCVLLGIFKPDLDNLIYEKPIIASKLLQSVSLIIANRLYSITQEVRVLKEKLRVSREKEKKGKES